MKEKINIKTLNNWRLEAYNLSNKFIAESSDISVPVVIDALKNGLASPETLKKLTTFFNNRKQTQKA